MRGFLSALTRRQALKLGFAAGVVTTVAGPSALARAATTGAPDYLRRSSWTPLVGDDFTVGFAHLTLVSVGDVAGADSDPALRGNEEAFVLAFDGPAGALDSATHAFAHPALGSFAFLVTAVGRPDGGTQRYEVVVDRSVGRPADPPSPGDPLPQAAAPAVAATAAGTTAAAKPAARKARKARKPVKRRRSHRARRRVVRHRKRSTKRAAARRRSAR